MRQDDADDQHANVDASGPAARIHAREQPQGFVVDGDHGHGEDAGAGQGQQVVDGEVH